MLPVTTPFRARATEKFGSSLGSETEGAGRSAHIGIQVVEGAGLVYTAIGEDALERVSVQMTSLLSLLFGILFSACRVGHEIWGKAGGRVFV